MDKDKELTSLALARAEDREWLRMEVRELKALLCAICEQYGGNVDIPIRDFKNISDDNLHGLIIEENLWNRTIKIEYNH